MATKEKLAGKLCCGCGACAQACPKHCISMKYEADGFLYPSINEEECIHCGKCRKVCSALDIEKIKEGTDAHLFACYHADEQQRKLSMTGGVCFLLGQLVIEAGGVVFGVVEDSIYDVHHVKCSTVDELQKTRNSKYLQSETKSTYSECEKELKSGKPVLYTGTPCQISGLHHFLGKDYDNLYTVDLICHGVPSRYVFKKYIDETSNHVGKEIVAYYRNKSLGAYPTWFSREYADGSLENLSHNENIFNKGFVTNLFQRTCCLNCQYARIPRCADISVGDYFVGKRMKELDPDNLGLSMVVVSTAKGMKLFEKAEDFLVLREFPLQEGIDLSEHLAKPPKYNVFRDIYMKLIHKFDFYTITPFFTANNILIKGFRRMGQILHHKK